jgi:hypothetical protein
MVVLSNSRCCHRARLARRQGVRLLSAIGCGE